MMSRTGTTPIRASLLLAGLCFALALPLSACSRVSCGVQGAGTIKHLTFEGGFYGIEADSGAHYRPVNLPGEFARDGLRVRFCAEPLKGVMSFHMWGTPVEIVEMEPLKKGRGIESNGQSTTPEPRKP
jgi:hypothetical protein